MEWISVKGRFPKAHYVLAYGIKNDMPGSYIARYLKTPIATHWIVRENTSLYLQDVTHWMPLPKPPKIDQ